MVRRRSQYKDDSPTIPDMPSGVPRAPLDVESAPVDLRGGTPTARLKPEPVGGAKGRAPAARPSRARGVDVDGLWTIYEAGLRAWGKMTVTGAPREVESEVVNG